MKKLILTLTASLACVAAFAQGKVAFNQDSLHLSYYGTVAAADAALAGQGCGTGVYAPAGVTLVADLYAGTAAGSLSLVSTTTFSAVPGKWNSASVTVPGIAGGTVAFMEVQIRDQAFAAPTTFTGQKFGTYYGTSAEFQFTLGGGITYPVMWGASGTWAAGTFPLDQYGTGSKGAIQVNLVHEHASFALAGLGIAEMTIFRRR
jgi:hypothetical protein